MTTNKLLKIYVGETTFETMSNSCCDQLVRPQIDGICILFPQSEISITRSELVNHKKEIRIISATQENIPLTSEALWAGEGSFQDLQIKLEHKGS